jgi:hypothetical protein
MGFLLPSLLVDSLQSPPSKSQLGILFIASQTESDIKMLTHSNPVININVCFYRICFVEFITNKYVLATKLHPVVSEQQAFKSVEQLALNLSH